ncbi:MAG: hypothetical protein AAGF59_01040 [Pseudomonadota bacterium]
MLLALCALSILAAFLGAETVLRHRQGVFLTDSANWRLREIVNRSLPPDAEFDGALGTRPKAHVSGPDYNTTDYGLRKNRPDTIAESGGCLVVGDGFTAGLEVKDGETWPAFLERDIRQPVNNAGYGAYGLDQTILRAEQLLPLLKPKWVVVGILQNAILRTGYRTYGTPKPWFLFSNDALSENGPALVRSTSKKGLGLDAALAKCVTLAEHSLCLHTLLSKVVSSTWLAPLSPGNERVCTDEVEVACGLLDRLKRKAERHGATMIVVAQYGGGHHLNRDTLSTYMTLVKDHIAASCIPIVDEADILQGLRQSDDDALRRFFLWRPDGRAGHVSPFGNEAIAKAVHAELSGQGQTAPALESLYERSIQSSGFEREDVEQALQASEIATVTPLSPNGSGRRISAAGPTGEHYASLAFPEASAGRSRLTFRARIRTPDIDVSEPARKMRVQFLSHQGEGVLVDLDFKRAEAQMHRVGLARGLEASIRKIDSAWYEVRLAAAFRHAGRSIIFQLFDRNAELAFDPNGEAIDVKRVALS